MIEVKNLTKCYSGKHKAVDNISFTVRDGEILGFLGPNGAGKSTTMNIITGYLSSTEGSVKVGGYDILENPNEAKRHIGYLPEHPPLYMDMTVREYLNFIYDLKKVTLPREAHLREICNLVRIQDRENQVIKQLSKGYQQRVGIAQALVGNPELLILDEPTVGLDPTQIIEIRKLITHLGRNHTVILSSHILSDVQAVCERVIIIHKGKLIADGAPDDLSKQLVGANTLAVRVNGPERDVHKLLRTIPGVKAVNSLGKREKSACEFSVEVAENVDIRPEIFRRLAERNWPILMMQPNELTLEQIFVRLVNGEGEAVVVKKPEEALPDPSPSRPEVTDDLDEKLGVVEKPLDAPAESSKEEN